MSQFKLNSAPELRWKAMELADTFQRRGQEVQRREQESKANGRRGNESTEVCNEQKCTSFGFTYDELMFEEGTTYQLSNRPFREDSCTARCGYVSSIVEISPSKSDLLAQFLQNTERRIRTMSGA
mmetsp:Transcript_6494/g.9149  ORF Transcript_6494/g.9149 Transcript_6494/m.9149 type:complete len:125 (-) Transcript_6494:181-555(-)